jgi:predicted nucleotidyltransferase
MANAVDHLERVGEVVQDLRDLGLEPILVGGMALVVLGSRRVTRDFDFVVASPRDRLADTLDCFYDRGLELVSRLSDAGDVRATIGNRKVASIRLRQDAPASAYFFNVKTGLRIDLLFDFPIPAAELAERATRITIRSHVFHIAAEGDLLRLKQIAKAARSKVGDLEDIAFLEARHEK